MTEYDYSPEAYERYIAKQQSIARWVERQAQEAPRYANPFLPSDSGHPTPSRHTPAPAPPDERRHSVARSFSVPADARHSSPSPVGHHLRSHSHANGKSRTMHLYSAQHSSTPVLVPEHIHSHNSRSHSHSRSSSRAHARPPPSRSQNYMSNPALNSSQTQLHSSNSNRSHGSSSAHALRFSSLPGQPVIMHQGKQTYVVLPSRGGCVEVRSPNGVYASSSTRPPASAIPPYPVSSKKLPLLKRLFQGSNSHEGARRTDVPVMSRDARQRRTSFF